MSKFQGGNTPEYWALPFDERSASRVDPSAKWAKVVVLRAVRNKVLRSLVTGKVLGTRPCARCGGFLEKDAGPRQMYCSAACKQEVYRERRAKRQREESKGLF